MTCMITSDRERVKSEITCLIMKSRLRQALLDRLVLIKNMPKILYRCSNDTAPTCGADDEVKRAILSILNDSWGDGRERPFARLDEIGRRGCVAESIRLAGDREIVHLVVHDDASFGYHKLAAEKKIYGCGE